MKVTGALLVAVLNAAAAIASPIAPEVDASLFDISSIIKTQVHKRADDSIRSLNWAGASKSGTNVTSVTGTITVPRIQADPDDWTTGMAIFTAIDGYFSCPNEMLAAGIIVAAQKGYASDFTAFWRWTPDSGGSDNQIDFPIRAGHKIRMTVTLLSPTTSVGLVENLTTGQSDSRYLSAPNPLCGLDASWVVARYSSLGSLMRWADFLDPVTFTDASATTGAGETLNLNGADVLDIEQSDGSVLTDCNTVSSSSLTCSHV